MKTYFFREIAVRLFAVGAWARHVWKWTRIWVGIGAGSASACWGASHQHLNAGAFGSESGAALYFVNGDRFAASSGYVVSLEKAVDGPHAGFYRGSITLTSLAATLDYGGPAFGHAAMGARIEVGIETVEGPVGGRFGFWDQAGGEEGTELTFDDPVGTTAGTNRFVLSENDGSAGADPYGHVHGRIFTASTPGLYTVGLRLVETSGNGEGGTALHRPSDLYRLQFQAGVTVARVLRATGNEVEVVFGAPAGYRYQLEASSRLGREAEWKAVGEPLPGDDHLQTVRVPVVEGATFFRIKRLAA